MAFSSSSGQGGGPDLDSINKLLSDYMKKTDLDDILKRLQKCEELSKESSDRSKKQEKKHKKWKPNWI
jgi:hypothetical protein